MDAAELFCNIVRKYEQSLQENSNKLQKNQTAEKDVDELTFLEEALNLYSNVKSAIPVGMAIFNEKQPKTSKIKREKTNQKFYTFVKKIQLKEPVSLPHAYLVEFLKYLGLTAAEITEYIHENTRSLENWKLKPKEKKIQKSYWWIYFYDEDQSGQPGITRSLLSFQLFGKAKIINYESESNTLETYVGKYDIYEKDYLKLEMKLGVAREKNLSMLICLGPGDNVHFALGMFFNVHGKVYSGTMVAKKLSPEETNAIIVNDAGENNGWGYVSSRNNNLNKIEDKVKFFPATERSDEIGESIWNFFKDKKSSLLEIHPGIYSEEAMLIKEG